MNVKHTMRKAAPWVLPGVLTAIGTVWTVQAVGGLLADQAPGVFAYSAAVLYDAVWLYALAQEVAHKRQGSSARLPQALGWLFLAVSSAAILAHGLIVSTAAVAAIGAGIPVLAKATWIMAAHRDATRVGTDAQRRIDAVRSATRDRIAVERAALAAKADGYRAAADLEARELKALGRAQRTRHKAAETYAETATAHPVPDRAATVPEGFGLITDEDLATLLEGAVPDTETAGGTPSGTVRHTVPGTVDEKALGLLAAEVYATDPPPSLRQFRERMRDGMKDRNLKGSNALIDQLYRHEEALRADADSHD